MTNVIFGQLDELFNRNFSWCNLTKYDFYLGETQACICQETLQNDRIAPYMNHWQLALSSSSLYLKLYHLIHWSTTVRGFDCHCQSFSSHESRALATGTYTISRMPLSLSIWVTIDERSCWSFYNNIYDDNRINWSFAPRPKCLVNNGRSRNSDCGS